MFFREFSNKHFSNATFLFRHPETSRQGDIHQKVHRQVGFNPPEHVAVSNQTSGERDQGERP